MSNLASQHEKKIKQMLGEAGTSNSTYVFQDGSRLMFTLTSDPNPRVIGSEKSDAALFASEVKSFATVENGYKFTFKDGSAFEIKLGNSAKST